MTKLKLNTLNKQNLDKKEMNEVRGGDCVCRCGCIYQGQPGGSSSEDNFRANDAGCLSTPGVTFHY